MHALALNEMNDVLSSYSHSVVRPGDGDRRTIYHVSLENGRPSCYTLTHCARHVSTDISTLISLIYWARVIERWRLQERQSDG